MKFIKSGLVPIVIACALISLQACKAKKLAQKPSPTASTTTPPPAPAQSKQQPAMAAAPAPAPVQKPDYNFSNIQFEFNSSVLKTDAYPLLDKAASTMKIDPSAKFNLNGYASIEGTPEHNMILSEDRANSVKVYLVNAGVPAANITAKGFGTANAIGDNTTEDGRILNRRVEIHKQNSLLSALNN
jgi:OOP family OmpA-OmpF porin